MHTVEGHSQTIPYPQQIQSSEIVAPSSSAVVLYNGLRAAGVSITESVSNIQSLLHSPYRIAAARSLRGQEAQGLINLGGTQLQRRDTPRCWGTELNVTCRSLHCRKSVKSSENNVCTCFTRSAKRAECYQPHISCSGSLYLSATFAVMVGSRTSVKKSTWEIMWPSSTSGLGRGRHPTKPSKCQIPCLHGNLPQCQVEDMETSKVQDELKLP